MSSSEDVAGGGSDGTFPNVPSDTPTSYIEPTAPSIEDFNGSLVAATVTTVTFVDAHVGVRITNVSGSAPIVYTVDGSTPAEGTSPELAGVAGEKVDLPFDSTILAVVKLLSTGTPTYSVEGLDELELHEDEETQGTNL
jgi:hypothetical protein